MLKKTPLFSLFFIFLLVLSSFFIVSVNASLTYNVTFEGGTITQQYHDTVLHTKNFLNAFYIVAYNYTGTRGFICSGNAGGNAGWFNFSYDSSDLLSHFEFMHRPYSGASSYHIEFKNSTTGTMLIQLVYSGGKLYYYDYLHVQHEMTGVTSGIWKKIGFTFLANDTVNYFVNSTNFLDTPYNIVDFPRIDTVFMTTGVAQYGFYSDDYKFGIGDYNAIPGGGSSSGCTDFTGYYDVNHINEYDSLTVLPSVFQYLEFQNWYEMTANLYGFEFLVDYQQITKDNDLSHYGLFINGEFADNPICYYQYDSDRVALQWDFKDSPIYIENSKVIFEMYHDNIPSGSYAWYLPVAFNDVSPPTPDNIYYYSDTSHIDGLLSYSDMSVNGHKLSWRLFFNLEENTTVECDYLNNILLKDTSGNALANHPVYNIPFSYPYRTIFFDVFVNDTTLYSLNVYREGVPVGFTQYYPKTMTLCNGVYGFTPLNYGNYTVSLYDVDGYFLNETFNITQIDTSFAIWTYPNPSLWQSSVTIGIYAENPNRYANYSIGVSYNITLLNTFDTSKLAQVFYIPGFIGNYYYLETQLVNSYIRLFATNGTVYIPITPVYEHKIISADSTSYIDTNLKDDSGIINNEFIVYGKYYKSAVGSAKIYVNSQYVGDTQYGTFTFKQILNTPGTYVYTLREYVGSSYTVLASVTVTMAKEETPQDSGIQLDFGVFINTILGLLLVLLLTLSPAIVTIWLAQKSNITNINIPGLLYVAMFLLGIIVSCIIGWFPLWVLLFVIIGLALTVFILWLRSKSESE